MVRPPNKQSTRSIGCSSNSSRSWQCLKISGSLPPETTQSIMLRMREKALLEVLGGIQQLLVAESRAPISPCSQEIGLVQAVGITSLQGIASADSVEPQGRLAHIETAMQRSASIGDIIPLLSSTVTSLSNKVLKNA